MAGHSGAAFTDKAPRTTRPASIPLATRISASIRERLPQPEQARRPGVPGLDCPTRGIEILQIGISRKPLAVDSLIEKPCLHGPGRHAFRECSGSGGFASIIGWRVRRCLSAPSPNKSLFPFHFGLPFGYAGVSGSGRFKGRLSPCVAAVYPDLLRKTHCGARRTEQPSRRRAQIRHCGPSVSGRDLSPLKPSWTGQGVMRSMSPVGRTVRGARPGKLSAAERSALNQALAKALAFRDAGKMAEAREWAAELVRLLKSHDLLT